VDRLEELYPDLCEQLREERADVANDPWLVKMLLRIESDKRLSEAEQGRLRSFVSSLRAWIYAPTGGINAN